MKLVPMMKVKPVAVVNKDIRRSVFLDVLHCNQLTEFMLNDVCKHKICV